MGSSNCCKIEIDTFEIKRREVMKLFKNVDTKLIYLKTGELLNEEKVEGYQNTIKKIPSQIIKLEKEVNEIYVKQ